MKNRYSPIPSFLSIKFDSDFKLDNANFIRVFNSNKGSIGIVKENDSYNWRADNFPLDELELSLYKNQFDKIDGIINGEGSISSDQSSLVGRLAWSLGKYRNINLANSLFDFRVKNNYFYINSSLYPIDGGVIEVEFDSNKNDFILDPFLGSGTTAVVSKKLGRKYFGIEKEKNYFDATRKRLDNTDVIKDEYLDTLQNNRSKPRIPFGSLVEMGLIKPGTEIYDQKKKINAKIMVDGSIKYQQSEGSIHKVAAKIIGAESCNGWTFWHYKSGNSLKPIDDLRQRLRPTN